MALIFCDGFDDGLTQLGKWNSFSGITIAPAYGRNGSGVRIGDSSNFLFKQIAAADEHATMTLGFAYRRVTTTGLSDVSLASFRSDSGATTHFSIFIDRSSHVLKLFRGGELVVNDTMTLILNQWYYIELKVTLHDTTGAYELRINGQTRQSATSTDTKNAGTKTTIDSIHLSSGISNGDGNFDDIYVCNGAGATNNTFLGDLAIETLLPDSNGNSSLFVGSDGNSVDNYLLVDEAAPSTTDYVVGASVGNKDTYTFGNMVRTSGQVSGVMVSSYANKSDANPRTIKNVARSGASETLGPSNTLATTWTPHSNVFETDPNGGGVWTIPNVNAAEFGVEVDS